MKLTEGVRKNKVGVELSQSAVLGMFPVHGLSPKRIKYFPTRLKEGIVKTVNVERIDPLDTLTVPV